MEGSFHARFGSDGVSPAWPCGGSAVLAVGRGVDGQQLVGAALEQGVVDIAQVGVLLRDAQGAGFVCLEDGLGALSLALVAGGGLAAAATAGAQFSALVKACLARL